MDARVYMLAGTFALLVIALIGTVVSLIHAARSGRRSKARPLTPAEKPPVELPASILIGPAAAPAPQPEPVAPAPAPAPAPAQEPLAPAPQPAAPVVEPEPAVVPPPFEPAAAPEAATPAQPLIVPLAPDDEAAPLDLPAAAPDAGAAPASDTDLEAWMSHLPEIEVATEAPIETPAEEPDTSAGLLALQALLDVPETDAETAQAEEERAQLADEPQYAPVVVEPAPAPEPEAAPEPEPEAAAFLGVPEELLDGQASLHPVSVGPDGLETEPLAAAPELAIDTTELLSASADDSREPGEIAAAALRWLEAQAALDAQAEAAAKAAAETAVEAALAAEPLVESPAPELALPPELAPELLVEPTPVYEPAIEPVIAPAFEPAAAPEPTPVYEPAHVPASLPTYEPPAYETPTAPVPELILEPPAPAPAPEPAPVWLPPTLSGSEQAANAAAEPEADADAFWQTLLRNQQDLPSILSAEAPASVTPPAGTPAAAASPSPFVPPAQPSIPVVIAAPTERPAVVVHSADVEAPAPWDAPPVIAASRPARPRAVVRLTGDLHVAPSTGLPAAVGPVGSAPLGERGAAPEMAMAAPVEIWFGDYRVGVKAGTKTYEQFRRYADVLLEDLRNSND